MSWSVFCGRIERKDAEARRRKDGEVKEIVVSVIAACDDFASSRLCVFAFNYRILIRADSFSYAGSSSFHSAPSAVQSLFSFVFGNTRDEDFDPQMAQIPQREPESLIGSIRRRIERQ